MGQSEAPVINFFLGHSLVQQDGGIRMVGFEPQQHARLTACASLDVEIAYAVRSRAVSRQGVSRRGRAEMAAESVGESESGDGGDLGGSAPEAISTRHADAEPPLHWVETCRSAVVSIVSVEGDDVER